jgi:pyrroloquinoline quinone biosynthesis protein B
MRVRVLGSSAGGGLPQWNCGCDNCTRARRGDPAVPARTQSGLAVSADGARWSLFDASPDLRAQLEAFPLLHPRPGTRDLPLDSVVLTSAELDAALGLLLLREALPYRVVSTSWVREALLRHGGPFALFEPAWGAVKLDAPIALDRDGRLEARLFPLPGKLPGWLRDAARTHPEARAGVRVTDTETGRRLVWAPALRALDDAAWAELEAAALVFVDGTFFSADELQRLRPGAPDALAMGHAPIAGPNGTLERLAKHPGRRLYVHLNNTNPVLAADSREAAAVARAGVEVAADGQELVL